MADSPPTTTPGTSPEIQAIIDAIMGLDSQSGQLPLPQPIGVPQYTYDSQGNVVPWAAQIPHTGYEGAGGFKGLGLSQYEYNTQQAPRYFDGDEWIPAAWSPEKIADLQRSLIAAGLIDLSSTVRIGVYDDVTRSAFGGLLATSNGSGLSWTTALASVAAVTAKAGGAPGEASLPVKLSNPDDLKAIFRKVAIDTLGQGYTDDQLNGLVAAYQSQERAAQTSAYEQPFAAAASAKVGDVVGGGATPGGTTTGIVSPTTFAETQIREQNPALAGAHDILGGVDQFMSIIRSPAWSGRL